MSAPRIFDLEHYAALNRARGEVVTRLLSELNGPLELCTAIDVGCGLGHFSGVLQSMGFEVTGVDGRGENAEEAARRVPDVKFHAVNAEDIAIRSLGTFDLVFCFGLLYHLENPLLAIRNLRAMTGKVLLAEGVIFPGDAPTMGFVDEGHMDDQGLNHVAFYPTEACLAKMFYCAGFRFVYRFTTMPQHPDYYCAARVPRTRTMMVASVESIASRQLELVEEPATIIRPWDAQSVAANTSSVEALRGFSTMSFLEKLRTLGHLVRSRFALQRRARG